MEISSISGPDVIPQGFSAETRRVERDNPPTEEPARREPGPAEKKGGTIDTYA